MSIIVKDVKVTMSQLGVNVPGKKRRVLYMPSCTISYVDKDKNNCRTGIGELLGRFKKSDYLGKVVCGDFFVLIFKLEWEFISAEGKLLKSMPPCGKIVGVEENNIVVRNGDMITGYDKEGQNIGSRKLTSEEIKMLDEADTE